jgi:hypothetical protein
MADKAIGPVENTEMTEIIGTTADQETSQNPGRKIPLLKNATF